MLRSMDKKQLDEAVKKAQEFSKTEQGQKMVEKLRRGETIEGLPVTSEEQNRLIAEVTKKPQLAKKFADILGKKG